MVEEESHDGSKAVPLWPPLEPPVPSQDSVAAVADLLAHSHRPAIVAGPSGIGAAVARPERLSVAAVGDGGALMALGELETAARYGLPMLIVVYNDAAYGAEVHHFGPMGRPVELARFPETDFAAFARAAGANGITVRNEGDLSPVRDWLEGRDRPLIIDAKVNPEIRAEWLAEAFRSH